MPGKILKIPVVFIAAWLLALPAAAVDAPQAQAPLPPRPPQIGEAAPAFAAETTQGTINFPADFKGKWVILFSHPADFTPVCTTELMTLAVMLPEFEALNCRLIGLSVDSTYSHIAWLRAIQEKIEYKNMRNVQVAFPVVADVKMEIAGKYGMLQPAASDTRTVRAVFFIDPKGIIRAMMAYPLSIGRNLAEIKRLLVAMQTADAFNVALPADWQPGDDVIMAAPLSWGAARERMDNAGKDYYCLDWFMCLRKLPREQVPPAPVKK